ncbi:MAG TPA: phospholipase D family protein [Woeseiaceae bacterium]|nr:phospholipase D family protein [Woeseiaceae bacterium]
MDSWDSCHKVLAVLLLAVFFGGCASVDSNYPRIPSTALPADGSTMLGQQYSGVVAAHPPNLSGFHALPDGIDALAARILLAERAERSIDLQYYLIKNDLVGRAFLHSLLRAADRGVRVRLLLDDVFTSGYDAGMQALMQHPNFEIRVYNPFNRGFAGRALGSIVNFKRVNRRMHNKSFTVDNQATIIGGRNIAAEYFAAREDSNFGDLDVVAIGPIVNEVSNMFDLYWNHPTAYPVAAFAKPTDDPEGALVRLRKSLADAYDDVPNTKYAEAIGERFSAFARAGNDIYRWSPYRLVYDSPEKGLKGNPDDSQRISRQILEELSGAEHQIFLVSPYFVPRKGGIKLIKEFRAKGVEVSVITNSLAANNQFSVHAGYAPSRKPLLEAGVKIYEARPDAEVISADLVAASGAKATLHTKSFMVDNKEIFIGSFNFDPRSVNLNTEMGVIIRNQELADEYVKLLHDKLPANAYEVFLNEKNDLRWRGLNDGAEVIYKKEPQTSWWDRFVVGFVRILPIRSQL